MAETFHLSVTEISMLRGFLGVKWFSGKLT